MLICAALVVSTVAVYSQVVDFEYTEWDDPKYVTRNSNVNAGLTPEGIAWAFTKSHASNWHPLTWISHMLDCELFGLDSAGPHAVSLAFHILNTLLLFLVFTQMTGHMWPSGFVAALFQPVLSDLRLLVEGDLRDLESEMEAAGAPWTPGRVPRWTPD